MLEETRVVHVRAALIQYREKIRLQDNKGEMSGVK
ncbi:hypothetical protein CACET_c38570 [Clostridium aceticum]|uniref:Uncharacterized protein n=1 Tax=Clostridium aceticum TaxID=84022 RepID=A0A0G3WHB1_9CLOT|nr:hypothetical protein CACET_c38570 [Clostridium aceticum]